MTKLEEIARAICEESGLTWESATQDYRERCADFALAAVRAMRDVDDPMMLACWQVVAKDEDDPTDQEITAIWQAGIDSILSEAGEKP